MGALRAGASNRFDRLPEGVFAGRALRAGYRCAACPTRRCRLRQRCSRSAGSYVSMRAGSTCCSQAGAGNSNPCNCRSPAARRPGRAICRPAHMLPSEEEIHEVGEPIPVRSLCASAQGQTMNAREQHPIAPLDVSPSSPCWALRMRPVNWPRITTPALSKAAARRRFCLRGRPDARSQRLGADRPAHFEPALNDFFDRVFRRRTVSAKPSGSAIGGRERNFRQAHA